jgi:plastocyanin
VNSAGAALVVPPQRVRPRSSATLGRGGMRLVLLMLGVSLVGLAPVALAAFRRDAVTLSQTTIAVEVVADGMRFVPGEIRVPAGASVRVDFANTDPTTPHNFETLGQYRNTRVVLWPGERRTTGFIATDKPGRYPFICSVRGHQEAGMTGVIVVEAVGGR